MYGEEERIHETRCNHIPIYSSPDSKPSILELGPPVRHDPDGRSVLDGSVLLRGRDGVSETIIEKGPRSCSSDGTRWT